MRQRVAKGTHLLAILEGAGRNRNIREIVAVHEPLAILVAIAINFEEGKIRHGVHGFEGQSDTTVAGLELTVSYVVFFH